VPVTYNGPGLGFAFSNSDGTSQAMALISSQLPSCVQLPLDATYFYVYDCNVESSTVLDLGNIDGFLYTSDKSLTMVSPETNDSILLANSWNMTLAYSDAAACAGDAAIMSLAPGCVSSAKCETRGAVIEIGCGSLTCTGCIVEGFFKNLSWASASFDIDTGPRLQARTFRDRTASSS